MTRMTGPDCAVMCNLINTHTYTHTFIQVGRENLNVVVQGLETLVKIALSPCLTIEKFIYPTKECSFVRFGVECLHHTFFF